jgi:hypothetical protein
MKNAREVFEIRVGVYASEEQAREVIERIKLMLCPDPDHQPPCPIPWSIGLVPSAEGDYPDLAEQARIEQG